MKYEAELKRVSLFAGMDDRHLKGLSQICKEKTYAHGEHLMKQGDDGIGLYIILSGKVKIEKTTADGVQVEIAQNGPGDILGELAVIDGAKRTATVTAITETKCLVLASWEFLAFIKTHPEAAIAILPIVVQRFRETNDALTSLTGVKA